MAQSKKGFYDGLMEQILNFHPIWYDAGFRGLK